MANILQMTIQNAFSCMKIMIYFDPNFMKVCSWYKGPIYIGSGYDMTPNSQQAIIWTNDDQFSVTHLHHQASMS